MRKLGCVLLAVMLVFALVVPVAAQDAAPGTLHGRSLHPRASAHEPGVAAVRRDTHPRGCRV